jgi:hypothetical protein
MNVHSLQKLIKESAPRGRAIINNNNYTLTTNNDKNVNSCTPECDKELIEDLKVVSGLASRSAPQDIPPQVEVSSSGVGNLQNLFQEETIPANWEYVKLDLYDNATTEDLAKNKSKYKLAINIKKTGNTGWITFMAGLNTEIRFMKRGLDVATWESGHYLNVRTSYNELKQDHSLVRASKTYLKGYKTKGQTIENMSVVFAPTGKPSEYYINLHFGEQQWLWILKGGAGYLTQTQRKNNIIATAGVKRGQKVKNLDAKDLLA